MTRVRACGRGRSTCGISSPGLHTDPGGGLKFRLEWLRRQVRATRAARRCAHMWPPRRHPARECSQGGARYYRRGADPPPARRAHAQAAIANGLSTPRARTCVRRDLAVPSRRRPLPPRLLLLACLGLLATPMNSQSRAVGSLGLPSQA